MRTQGRASLGFDRTGGNFMGLRRYRGGYDIGRSVLTESLCHPSLGLYTEEWRQISCFLESSLVLRSGFLAWEQRQSGISQEAIQLFSGVRHVGKSGSYVTIPVTANTIESEKQVVCSTGHPSRLHIKENLQGMGG